MRYQPLELGETGQPACPDQYSAASTLFCPGAERVLLQVTKHAIMVQLGNLPGGAGGVGAIEWQGEWALLPLAASLGRSFDAIRVRNRVAGELAAVVVVVD